LPQLGKPDSAGDWCDGRGRAVQPNVPPRGARRRLTPCARRPRRSPLTLVGSASPRRR
jgi:hypothetical protein